VVGETGSLEANEEDTGAVPWYAWEVFPGDAGTIGDATLPSTTFQASKTGNATFRLTAGDGLWQVISECETEIITFASIVVTLSASTTGVTAGETVTLTCSTGRVVTEGTRTIDQIDGPEVTLTQTAEGVVTFTPDEGGEYTFECVAASADGEQVVSNLLAVTVAGSSDDQDNDNSGGDTDDNSNVNDNDGDDEEPPPTPPVRR
jgi:hypothetical protein